MKDYWFFLLLAAATALLVVARLSGFGISWWVVTAPALIFVFCFVGATIGLRIWVRRHRDDPRFGDPWNSSGGM